MTRKPTDIDPDRPLTKKELDAMGPWMHGIDGLPPEAQAAVRRLIGRPRAQTHKEKVTLRLDPHIVSALRGGGRGWQTRLNALLNQALSEGRL